MRARSISTKQTCWRSTGTLVIRQTLFPAPSSRLFRAFRALFFSTEERYNRVVPKHLFAAFLLFSTTVQAASPLVDKAASPLVDKVDTTAFIQVEAKSFSS